MKMLWQLSFRNILRHRRRNLMLFAAIAVAVAGVTATNTLLRGMQADFLEAAVANLTGHVKVHAPGYRDDPSIQRGFDLDDDFAPDLAPEQMRGWAARIRVPSVIMSERETRGVQLVGVDPQAEHISFLNSVQIDGDALEGITDDRILIGRELAADLETAIGRRVVILTQGADGNNREKGYRVAGTFDAEGTGLEKGFAFTGLERLQALLDTDQVTEVSVRMTHEQERALGKAALAEVFAGLDVKDWRELDPQTAAMYVFMDGGILIWFLLLMSALTFGLVNTLATSVMERVRELGMLRALGMRRRTVVTQVVIESMLIMAIGVVFGLLGGYLIYLWIGDGIDLSAWAQGAELAGMSSYLRPVLLASDVIAVVVMSLVLGVFASLYPAWRAVNIKPLEALSR